MAKDKQQEILEALRQAVWEKAIGNTEITPGSHYWKKIGQAIEDTLGNSHPLHQDTIRNFFKGRHQPRPDTLDIFSRYVLGDAGAPKTFTDFVSDFDKASHSQPPASTFERKSGIFTYILAAGSILFLGIAVLLLSSEEPSQTTAYAQRFRHSDLDSLTDEGWFLYDPDTSVWDRYPQSGYLTLETFQGDYWLDDPNYPTFVKNVLARKIACGPCCEITVKLVDFNPFQRYHQAGFVLFYDRDFPPDQVPSVRLTITQSWFDSLSHFSAVYRAREYENIVLLKDVLNERTYVTKEFKDGGWSTDTVWMRLRMEGNQHTFFRKAQDETNFLAIKTEQLPVSDPQYLGLAAFQGFPLVPPVIPIADTIPAHFEYVEISPCQ